MGDHRMAPNVTEQLLDLGLPTVIVDTICPSWKVSVDVDDLAVGAEVARTFVQAGYTFCMFRKRDAYSEQRIAGFLDEVRAKVPV